MNNRMLEHFSFIQNVLKNREEPVNIFKISKEFNLSIKESKLLLNNFIRQKNLLNEYVVIFSAEIIEDNKIKSILISNKSNELNNILNLQDNLLDFGIYAICKKYQDFMLNDFSVFCHENTIVDNIVMTTKVINDQKTFNKKEEIPIQGFENANNKISSDSIKTTIASVGSKLASVKVNPSSNKTNKNENSLSKAFNNKVNVSSNNLNNFTQIKKEIKTNIEVNTNIEIKCETNTDDLGEENYYGQTDNNLFGKRKHCEYSNSEETKNNQKKNSNKLNGNNKTNTVDKSDSESSDADNNFEIRNNNNKANDYKYEIELEKDPPMKNSNVDIEFSSLQNDKPPNKIRKIRRVKKTNTYKDEKGYLRTIDEWEDEEYWTDEKPKPVLLQSSFINNNDKSKKPTKKIAPGQSSLNNFFKKQA